MAKTVLWAITLIGLAPSVLLIIGTSSAMRFVNRSPWMMRYRGFAIHDVYCSLSIGSISVSVFPRTWAFVLIAIGIISIVLGMIFLLHIPFGPLGKT